MITIKTLTNSFILNGSQYQKGSLVVTPTTDGVKIGAFYDTFGNIEVDGETYASAQLLHEALDTKLFKSGGGNGNGVTVQQVWDIFESMTIEDDELVDEQTNESLNAKYEQRPSGFRVVAPNVGSGMGYIKLDSSEWFSYSGMKLI